MRKLNQYVLVFAIVLTLTACLVGAGWAVVANPYTSSVVDSVWPYSNQLTAQVTSNPNGSYHYLYTLVYADSAFGDPLTDFSVGNVNNLAYTNPQCSASSFTMANSQDSVYWYVPYGVAPAGQTVTFSYDSFYTYTLVDVTIAGGLPSNGLTLGMIPEPSSLLALAFGLGGVLCTRLRRRS